MVRSMGKGPEETTVFQFSNDKVVGQGLRALLAGPLGFTVVGEAETVGSGLALIKELRPQVVLCGASPDRLTPGDVVARLADTGLDIPVLVLTREADPAVVRDAVRVAVRGFLLVSETTPQQLAQAILAVKRGLTVFGPHVTRIMSTVVLQAPAVPTGPAEGLTERERQILDLLAQGLQTKDIAARLGLSLRTVQLHVSHLLGKLGAHSRLEAAVRGLQFQRLATQVARLEAPAHVLFPDRAPGGCSGGPWDGSFRCHPT